MVVNGCEWLRVQENQSLQMATRMCEIGDKIRHLWGTWDRSKAIHSIDVVSRRHASVEQRDKDLWLTVHNGIVHHGIRKLK
jgi:hypothetical protein